MTLPSGHLKSKLIKNSRRWGLTFAKSSAMTTVSFRLPGSLRQC